MKRSKIITLLCIICVLMLALVACGSEKESKKDSNNNKKETVQNDSDKGSFASSAKENEKLINELEYDISIVNNSDAVAMITNNSNKNLFYVQVKANAYDKNGKMVDENDDEILIFEAGSTAALAFSFSADEIDNVKLEFSSEDIDDSEFKEINKLVKCYNSDVEIKFDKNAKNIDSVEVVNNSNDLIEEIDYSLVFYKNGKIVDYSGSSIFDLNAKTSEEDSVLTTISDYDDVKAFVNYAYSEK